MGNKFRRRQRALCMAHPRGTRNAVFWKSWPLLAQWVIRARYQSGTNKQRPDDPLILLVGRDFEIWRGIMWKPDRVVKKEECPKAIRFRYAFHTRNGCAAAWTLQRT